MQCSIFLFLCTLVTRMCSASVEWLPTYIIIIITNIFFLVKDNIAIRLNCGSVVQCHMMKWYIQKQTMSQKIKNVY